MISNSCDGSNSCAGSSSSGSSSNSCGGTSTSSNTNTSCVAMRTMIMIVAIAMLVDDRCGSNHRGRDSECKGY